eukprot:5206152-Heterocapsa_arctica.AAC.1
MSGRLHVGGRAVWERCSGGERYEDRGSTAFNNSFHLYVLKVENYSDFSLRRRRVGGLQEPSTASMRCDIDNYVDVLKWNLDVKGPTR